MQHELNLYGIVGEGEWLSYFTELLRLLPSVSEVDVLDEPIQCPSDLGRGAAWNVRGQGFTFRLPSRYIHV